jgi:hypothetical protein
MQQPVLLHHARRVNRGMQWACSSSRALIAIAWLLAAPQPLRTEFKLLV